MHFGQMPNMHSMHTFCFLIFNYVESLNRKPDNLIISFGIWPINQLKQSMYQININYNSSKYKHKQIRSFVFFCCYLSAYIQLFICNVIPNGICFSNKCNIYKQTIWRYDQINIYVVLYQVRQSLLKMVQRKKTRIRIQTWYIEKERNTHYVWACMYV